MDEFQVLSTAVDFTRIFLKNDLEKALTKEHEWLPTDLLVRKKRVKRESNVNETTNLPYWPYVVKNYLWENETWIRPRKNETTFKEDDGNPSNSINQIEEMIERRINEFEKTFVSKHNVSSINIVQIFSISAEASMHSKSINDTRPNLTSNCTRMERDTGSSRLLFGIQLPDLVNSQHQRTLKNYPESFATRDDSTSFYDGRIMNDTSFQSQFYYEFDEKEKEFYENVEFDEDETIDYLEHESDNVSALLGRDELFF